MIIGIALRLFALITSRIPYCHGAGNLINTLVKHSLKLIVVCRCKNSKTHNGVKKCRIKNTLMAFAVLTHKSGTVNGKNHLKSLHCNIVNKLII